MMAFRPLRFPKLRTLLPAVLILSLTSCIEITEQLSLAPDRSGRYILSADAGALASLLMMSGSLDEESLHSIEKQLRAMADQLQDVQGLSDILIDTDIRDGRLSLGFGFTNPAALNRALFALSGMEKKWFLPGMYNIGKKRVIRRNITPFLRQAVKEDFPEWEQARSWIGQIRLQSRCELPGPVSKSKGQLAKHKGNSAQFQWNALEVMEEGTSLRYRLRFDPID